ncbi:MAG: hypothetical protein ABI740_08785, partial [Alphaproteobacteria bacterium]
GAPDNKIGGAVQQPFRDVGIVRVDPPEILRRAAAAPYALPNGRACTDILIEIAQLDDVLGPDLDVLAETDKPYAIDVPGVTAGAITSATGLPFRGIFRWASGADKRQRILATAILSGMARRAFLKGIALADACVASPLEAKE